MASFRTRGPYQWQAHDRTKGHPLQTKTLGSRAEAESTTLTATYGGRPPDRRLQPGEETDLFRTDSTTNEHLQYSPRGQNPWIFSRLPRPVVQL